MCRHQNGTRCTALLYINTKPYMWQYLYIYVLKCCRTPCRPSLDCVGHDSARTSSNLWYNYERWIHISILERSGCRERGGEGERERRLILLLLSINLLITSQTPERIAFFFFFLVCVQSRYLLQSPLFVIQFLLNMTWEYGIVSTMCNISARRKFTK